ncbi:hypothetical protein BKA62DRAFT_775495 [Auriculariales sp. MPI-PUGE-AT-0066]|nr:hypothetical protein BKA62DRAFT_775495 [Auriculariales sp. MPI-PUGE-AT-0066]
MFAWFLCVPPDIAPAPFVKKAGLDHPGSDEDSCNHQPSTVIDDHDSDQGGKNRKNIAFKSYASQYVRSDAPISPGGFNTALHVIARPRIPRRASFGPDTRWRAPDPEWTRPAARAGYGGGGRGQPLSPYQAYSTSFESSPRSSPPVATLPALAPSGVTTPATSPLIPPPTELQVGSIVAFCMSGPTLQIIAPRTPLAHNQAATIGAQHFLGLVYAINPLVECEPRTRGLLADAAGVVHAEPDAMAGGNPYGDGNPYNEVFIAFFPNTHQPARQTVPARSPSSHSHRTSFPATQSPRPSHIARRLPYRDMVAHTTIGVRARLGTVFGIRGAPIVIAPADVERFRLAVAEDLQSQVKAHAERVQLGTAAGPPVFPRLGRVGGHWSLPVDVVVDVSLNVGLAGDRGPRIAAWHQNEASCVVGSGSMRVLAATLLVLPALAVASNLAVRDIMTSLTRRQEISQCLTTCGQQAIATSDDGKDCLGSTSMYARSRPTRRPETSSATSHLDPAALARSGAR